MRASQQFAHESINIVFDTFSWKTVLIRYEVEVVQLLSRPTDAVAEFRKRRML